MLSILPSSRNRNSPLWMVFEDDRFLCVANFRWHDDGIQNTRLGHLTSDQEFELKDVFRRTVTRHQEWCDLYNHGIDCSCDYGMSKEKARIAQMKYHASWELATIPYETLKIEWAKRQRAKRTYSVSCACGECPKCKGREKQRRRRLAKKGAQESCLQ